MKKKKITIPHTYSLLFMVVILMAILTYFVPAGSFERVEDPKTSRIMVIPNSYHSVESQPVSIFETFKAIPTGMENVGYIIFFVLMIGGTFGILKGTGAIDSGIYSIVTKMKGHEKLVIPVTMFVFSLAGAILGSAEEMLPFYPIVISLALALGFDSLTGTAMVLLGAGSGFVGAFLNPFTIGIAQGIAGLPLFSGIAFRLLAYVTFLSVSIIFVYRYAGRIQKDPTLSITYEEDKTKVIHQEDNENFEFTTKHKLVLCIFLIGLIGLAYGIIKLDFYIKELTATFLMIGIISGAIGGLGINGIAEKFVEGAQELVYGALIIGLASSIMVVMEEGMILDTFINSLSKMVEGFPPIISGGLMFIVQSIINFFIPSGSGQAAASMPIMAPMADLVNITRQTAVLAFQFGDGISNVINPTSGYFMAALAIGGIKWEKYVKWFLPLFIIWNILAIAFVMISVLIGYGPF